MHAVFPNLGDMGIAVMPDEDRKQEGRQHGLLIGGVVARIAQWAVCYPGLKETAHLQELDKEGQLHQRGDGVARIPLDVDTTAKRIEHHGFLCL